MSAEAVSMSWRKNIFVPGALYRVEQPFDITRNATFSFAKGEVLRFQRYYYSHVDSETCYEFMSQIDGTLKYWALSDEHEADLWKNYFTHLT